MIRVATQLVVLLGHGIGYSASPAMHNAAFAALGLPLRYELRDVGVEGLSKAVARLRDQGMRGANVTQPHKAAVVPLLDDVAPEASGVEAVNTIVKRGGRLIGRNTDVEALTAELATFEGVKRAVILGRGGAARSAAAVLADRDVEAELVGRDRWHDLPTLMASVDLLVNATPVGTASDESPVEASLLRPDLAVLDLVYRPSPTRLVREARGAGARAVGGAGMLLRQAALAFSLWTDVPAPMNAMRDALRAELGPETDA